MSARAAKSGASRRTPRSLATHMLAMACWTFAPTALTALALALALASSTATVHAQQQRIVEHTVTEGETCASIARRYFGSARAYDLLHDANPELGPQPHHLRAGAVLHIPVQRALAGPLATLTAAQNDVRARPPGGVVARAHTGAPLVRGHQVETGDASSAQVTFRDETRIDLRENTLVIVYGGTERLARLERRATLERGALRGRLAELAGRFEVETPGGVANVARADAIVTVGEDGSSRLANLDGRDLTLTGGNTTVRIPAGTGTVMARGGTPLPPRPLPDAPSWQNDLAGRFVGLTGVGATLRGSWLPARGASRYRVEIAREPDGGDVVAAVEVPGSATRFEVPRIAAGIYYVSVATIDDALLEGRPSPRRAMQVLEARIIPPGGGVPIETPFDPGDPSEAHRAPRVLPGTWIVSPVGFTCGPANEVPRGMSTLRTSGLVRVQCFDPGNREVPGFDVVVEPPRLSIDRAQLRVSRGTTSEIVFSLDSPHALPGILEARASAGLEVTSARTRPDGRYALTVTVAHASPAAGELSIGVAEGNEHVPLARLSLTLAEKAEGRQSPGAGLATLAEADPVAHDDARALRQSGPRAEAPALTAPSPPRAFAIAAQPSTAPLDAPTDRGIHAESALSVIAASDGSDPVVRAALGARARLFGEPLTIGFDWIVDVTDAVSSIANRGNGDVLAHAAFALPPVADVLFMALSIDAWLPTGATDRGLDDVRVLPSVSLDLAAADPVVVRTRQGAILDTGGHAFLWAWALGADVALIAPLRVGLELDGTLGSEDGRDLSAFALGGGAVLDLSPVELHVAGRVGLGDDGQATFGAFAGSVALRLRVDAL